MENIGLTLALPNSWEHAVLVLFSTCFQFHCATEEGRMYTLAGSSQYWHLDFLHGPASAACCD